MFHRKSRHLVNYSPLPNKSAEQGSNSSPESGKDQRNGEYNRVAAVGALANPHDYSSGCADTESPQSAATRMAPFIQNHAPNFRSRHSPQEPILFENKLSLIC